MGGKKTETARGWGAVSGCLCYAAMQRRGLLFADGDFDTAVLGAAFGGGVALDGFSLALADSGDAVGGDATLDKHLLDVDGTVLRELHVGGGTANVVGVAGDGDFHFGMFVHDVLEVDPRVVVELAEDFAHFLSLQNFTETPKKS